MGTAVLASAQANLLGTVLNDMQCPTLGAEIAREAQRLQPFAPRFANWVSGKALDSSFLNSAAA
jgi:hypothetical protein